MKKTFLSGPSTKLIYAGCILLYLIAILYFVIFNKVDRGPAPIYFITNLILISIPLILLFSTLAVILHASQQRTKTGLLSGRLAKIVYYLPRISGIIIAIFISLFALDVFDLDGTIWQKIVGFIIHAAPAIIFGLVMFFAWKRPVIGVVVFGLGAIFFLRFVFMGTDFDFSNFLIFSCPLGIISYLFFLNWKWKLENKPSGS